LPRTLILSLVGLVLFAAAAWAGFHVANRVAPERLRIETERGLSKLLGAPVAVEQTRITLRWGLFLEARGVEVEPGGTGNRLRAKRVSARLDPVALWMARFRFDWLILEGASFNIERTGRDPGKEGGGDLRPLIAALDAAARLLLEGPLPVRTVELRGGTILFTDSSLEEPLGIRIEALSGRARRASFRRRAELRVEGRIRTAIWEGGAVRLEAAADRTLRATLTLEQMDLAILAPYASLLGGASELGGVTQGSVRWQHRPGRPQNFEVRLEGNGLRASLLRRGEKKPFRIALERATLAARLEASPEVLRLRDGKISDGEVTLRAEGDVALPVERSAGLRLALQLDEVPLLRLREVLAYLPPELRAWLDPLGQRLETGRLLELRAEARTTVVGLRKLVETRLLGRPGEITVRGEIADAGLRIGKENRLLEELSGRASWSGEVLELRGLRGRLDGRPLPKLDATVRGLGQIRAPDEVTCIPPPSKVSLPGFKGLRSWIGSRSRRRSAEPAWQQIVIEADWILHPALLCSLEQGFGEITPAPDGFDFAVQRGVWAGIPIRGEGSYRRAPEQSLQVELSLGPPFEPMSLAPVADPWARGRWAIEATRLGGWAIRGASGRFQTTGSTLRLEESTLRLAPLGEVEGNVEVALHSDAELPFRLELQVRKMDVLDLTVAAGREQQLLSGRLVGGGVVTGRLHQGLPLLGDSEGRITLHAREGKIQQELPPFVAIAVASDRFDPFRARDELPYTAIDLVGRLEDGRLHSDFLALDAPSLGAVVSGQVGLIRPYGVEAVMGLFFFRTLDSLINRVPVLNRVILGHDENLVGAYFAMTGTWKKPKAQLIPIKSFAEGPAHFMLEGPSFVWSGLKQLETLLNPPSDSPAAPEEAASQP
jgi:hypothetical protein